MTKAVSKSLGFTIVELLVVIVVIGILAAITVVSYTGVSQKAIAASLQSDLNGASKKLKMYQIEYGAYPAAITLSNGLYCPNPDLSGGKYCFKASPGNNFTSIPYSNPTTQSFILTAVSGSNTYHITENSASITGVYVDPYWIPGITATWLAGKFVYYRDIDSTDAPYFSNKMMFKTSPTNIISPQGLFGHDPEGGWNIYYLVSPQANPGVDFSEYPAQNACKAIGGRLPIEQELLAIYSDQGATFKNLKNSFSDKYWSSVASSVQFAETRNFGSPYGATIFYKTNTCYVRCVKD